MSTKCWVLLWSCCHFFWAYQSLRWVIFQIDFMKKPCMRPTNLTIFIWVWKVDGTKGSKNGPLGQELLPVLVWVIDVLSKSVDAPLAHSIFNSFQYPLELPRWLIKSKGGSSLVFKVPLIVGAMSVSEYKMFRLTWRWSYTTIRLGGSLSLSLCTESELKKKTTNQRRSRIEKET